MGHVYCGAGGWCRGCNGSQLWDTSFAVQVCVSAHGACVLWGRWVVQGLQRQPAVGHVLRGAGACACVLGGVVCLSLCVGEKPKQVGPVQLGAVVEGWVQQVHRFHMRWCSQGLWPPCIPTG